MDQQDTKYLFTSSRLGFRKWLSSDLEQMSVINNNQEVMEFFPFLPSRKQTEEFIRRMQNQFLNNGFCYFPVELLSTGEFIGFIGLSEQKYESDFTPCIDIGWRIAKRFWGQGLATEGAKKCLDYARDQLDLKLVYATAPKVNTKSIAIMKKIGMRYAQDFLHPNLSEHPKLSKCVLYLMNL